MASSSEKRKYGVFPKDIWRHYIYPYVKTFSFLDKQSFLVAIGLRPTSKKMSQYLQCSIDEKCASWRNYMLKQVAWINDQYPLVEDCSRNMFEKFFNSMFWSIKNVEDWMYVQSIVSKKDSCDGYLDHLSYLNNRYDRFGFYTAFFDRFTTDKELVISTIKYRNGYPLKYAIVKKDVNLFKLTCHDYYKDHYGYISRKLIRQAKKEIVDQKLERPCLALQQMFIYFFNLDIWERRDVTRFLFDKKYCFNGDNWEKMMRFLRICGVIPEYTSDFAKANTSQIYTYIDCDGAFHAERKTFYNLHDMLEREDLILVLNYYKSKGKCLQYLDETFWLRLFTRNFDEEKLKLLVQLLLDLGVKKHPQLFQLVITSNECENLQQDRTSIIEKLILFGFPMELSTNKKTYSFSVK